MSTPMGFAAVAILPILVASPASLPMLSGTYGTLAPCSAGGTSEPIPDDSWAYIRNDRIAGHEWQCDFTSAKPDGPHSWTVKADCAAEGIEQSATLHIAEEPKKWIGITGTDYFEQPLLLPSCEMPRDKQIRIEEGRLQKLRQ
jgi:hypothetical protein